MWAVGGRRGLTIVSLRASPDNGPGSADAVTAIEFPSIAGPAGQKRRCLRKIRLPGAIPAGASNLSVATSNAAGDLDLYVRFSAAPTLSQYDCRPYSVSGNEACTFTTPAAGIWYVRVYGFDTGVQNYTVRTSWTPAEANQQLP